MSRLASTCKELVATEVFTAWANNTRSLQCFRILDVTGTVGMYHGKVSPFDLNLRRCRLLGWWKINTKSRSKKFAYSLYRWISVSWLHVFTLLQLLDLLEAYDDLDKFSTNVCGTSVSIISLCKIVAVLYKASTVEKLRARLAESNETSLDESEKRILIRGYEEILQMTKIFFALVIPTIVGWSVMPFIDESKEKRMPLRLWIPFEWHSSPGYEIFYAYQVLGLWLFAMAIVSHDLVIFGFIIQISSQYEILEKNIKELDELCECEKTMNEGRLVREIKKSIIHHQDILQSIKKLQSIYKECFLAHFGGAVPLLCVIGFNIITAGRKTGLNTLMASRIGYVGSSLFDIFFFCYFGERLRQKGLRIAEAVYESTWYEMGTTPRKLLMVVMTRAQFSPGLTAGSILTINLRAFLHILRTSYNILALMNQMSH